MYNNIIFIDKADILDDRIKNNNIDYILIDIIPDITTNNENLKTITLLE